jgi:S-adenosylmethionine synthetase
MPRLRCRSSIDGHKPVRASAVVVSTQHASEVKQKEIRESLIELLIKKVHAGGMA